MRLYKFSLLAFSILTINACAIGTMRISSSPDKAEVFVTYEGGQPQKLGDTPLSLDSRLLEDKRGKFLTVSLKKDGYRTESIILPTSMIQSSVTVSTKLDEFKLPLACQDSSMAVDKIAKGIASSQSLIKANRLMDAEQKVSLLINEYPNVSVLHDLLGNIQYMNKNLAGALKAYDKSLELEPNNLDTQRIRNKLRTIVGDRVPSSNAGGQ